MKRNKDKDKDKERKYRRIKPYLWLAAFFMIFAIALSAAPVRTQADFGDFSGDSDYGGGGDWGGSDDWGGSSWDSDYSYSGSGSGGSSSIWDLPLAVVIVIIMLIFMSIKDKARKKGKGSTRSSGSAGATPAKRSDLKSMSAYKELDPNFNESALREKVSNLYVQMQQEWHNRNIESLKPYFTDAFYNQMDRQLQQKIRDKRTPCTERIAVLEVSPLGFFQDDELDHIVVKLRTRIIDYELDDRTGKVVSGDRKREKFMEYEWDLCRKKGVVTSAAGGMQNIECPNCGAPLNINQTAKCPYCGSVVTVVNEDWALDNIKGISQRTN